MWILNAEICPDIGGSGIDECAARAADQNCIINLNGLFLTPLPGTRLWGRMNADESTPSVIAPKTGNMPTYPLTMSLFAL
jgi:hypothetical protein